MLKTTFPLGLRCKTIPSICWCPISLAPNASFALLLASGRMSTTARDNYGNRRQGSRCIQCHLAAPLLVSLTSCRRPSGLRRTIAIGVSSQENLGAVLSGRIKIAHTESLLLVPHTQISTLSVARALLHTVWLPGV